MNRSPRKLLWLMVALSVAIAAAAARYFVLPLSSASGGAFGRHLSVHGLLLYAHAGGGAVALLAGALQWLTTSRSRRSRWHRRLGLVYVTAIVIGGLFGLVIALRAYGGLPARAGFAMLAVVWLVTTGRAYLAARARDWDGHRNWMIRSFALTFAAVTLRIWLPVLSMVGLTFDAAYPMVAWACWVPNLAVAEWIVARDARIENRSPARARQARQIA